MYGLKKEKIMAEIKFCPKCGAERIDDVQKCSCGYMYPKKELSKKVVVAIALVISILFTLSVLGPVVVLTVPTLINRQKDVEAVIKLKKAISQYEDIAAIYMAEKEKDSFANAIDSNCENIDDYFYIVNKQDCNFTSADGTYWEVDPNTGNAAISDSKDHPRYSITVWTENGKVNDENNIPENIKMPAVEPEMCICYPETFLRLSPSQIRNKCINYKYRK